MLSHNQGYFNVQFPDFTQLQSEGRPISFKPKIKESINLLKSELVKLKRDRINLKKHQQKHDEETRKANSRLAKEELFVTQLLDVLSATYAFIKFEEQSTGFLSPVISRLLPNKDLKYLSNIKDFLAKLNRSSLEDKNLAFIAQSVATFIERSLRSSIENLSVRKKEKIEFHVSEIFQNSMTDAVSNSSYFSHIRQRTDDVPEQEVHTQSMALLTSSQAKSIAELGRGQNGICYKIELDNEVTEENSGHFSISDFQKEFIVGLNDPTLSDAEDKKFVVVKQSLGAAKVEELKREAMFGDAYRAFYREQIKYNPDYQSNITFFMYGLYDGVPSLFCHLEDGVASEYLLGYGAEQDAVTASIFLPKFCAELIEALNTLHYLNIIHTDMHISNVLIRLDKDRKPSAVLTDFGTSIMLRSLPDKLQPYHDNRGRRFTCADSYYLQPLLGTFQPSLVGATSDDFGLKIVMMQAATLLGGADYIQLDQQGYSYPELARQRANREDGDYYELHRIFEKVKYLFTLPGNSGEVERRKMILKFIESGSFRKFFFHLYKENESIKAYKHQFAAEFNTAYHGFMNSLPSYSTPVTSNQYQYVSSSSKFEEPARPQQSNRVVAYQPLPQQQVSDAHVHQPASPMQPPRRVVPYQPLPSQQQVNNANVHQSALPVQPSRRPVVYQPVSSPATIRRQLPPLPSQPRLASDRVPPPRPPRPDLINGRQFQASMSAPSTPVVPTRSAGQSSQCVQLPQLPPTSPLPVRVSQSRATMFPREQQAAAPVVGPRIARLTAELNQAASGYKK